LDSEPDEIAWEGRTIGIGANPIGADLDGFLAALRSEGVALLCADLERRWGKRKLILGVERLDYTKGVPLKLQAFERFLARDPRRAKQVVLLQVLVPSRESHPEYRD